MNLSHNVIRKIAKDNGLSMDDNVISFAQDISNHVSSEKKVIWNIIELIIVILIVLFLKLFPSC